MGSLIPQVFVSSATMSLMKRTVVIGFDGFSPDLAAKWMSEGRLPHLSLLKEQGAVMPLQGLTPPITYPAWTTCVTGVNPGKHGLLDFTEMLSGRYAFRFMNSSDRTSPALWNILSDMGKRVCVLGVPGTYPPEAVNGILMAGFDSPVADSVDHSFVYPQSAYAKVRDWRFAEFQEHRITDQWYNQAFVSLQRKIDVKERVALDMLAGEPWDFFMVVFGEADTASHHFWPLEDAESPRSVQNIFEPEHPIRTIYERLDRVVSRIMTCMDEDSLLIVVSDHGFGGADTRAVHLNNFLAEHGWLRFCTTPNSLLKQVALRWLPVRGRGRLFRRFKGIAEKAESRSRLGGIEWAQTKAWSEELDYFPSVRLNLIGREPNGTVSPIDYDKTVAFLCRLLETMPEVSRALPRREVYDGPHITKAPDIILEFSWDTGYRPSCLRARGGPAVRAIPREAWKGGKEAGCAGVHRNPAFLAINRPIISKQPALVDIAPTILDYLGVSGPAMEGVSMLTGEKYEGAESCRKWTRGVQKSYTKDEEKALEERMRLLGYYE